MFDCLTFYNYNNGEIRWWARVHGLWIVSTKTHNSLIGVGSSDMPQFLEASGVEKYDYHLKHKMWNDGVEGPLKAYFYHVVKF